MRLLVCGLHRSGTSLTAHLIARAEGYKIVDDPDFAVFEADGPLRLLAPLDWLGKSLDDVVVKMPRAAEYLDAFVGSDWKTIFVARKPTAVFRSILEAQFGTRDSVRSMLCYQRAPTRNPYLNGFIDAYIFYYSQVVSTYEPEHCQVCDYDQLVSTLASATKAFGLKSDLSALAKAYSEIGFERIDPPHNKPAERGHVINANILANHLPPDVIERIEMTCASIFEEVRALSG